MDTEPVSADAHAAVLGCLLGTAVGDAVGLPTEGMSREKARRLHRSGVRHRLIFGRGMFSDDTEHTLMVACSLIRHLKDPVAFQRSLGWSMRWWLVLLPVGVGLSTAKAILRLWLGYPPHRSGVRSGGNGAAMRSALLGAVFSQAETRRIMTLAACRVTHQGPYAEESAIMVAEAAAFAVARADVSDILTGLRSLILSDDMRSRFAKLEAALQHGDSVAAYAAEIGCEKGVSGFAPNSVAVALYAWLKHRGHYERILTEVIGCGGDTDTVAAIAGGIAGIEVGEEGIPTAWVQGICDWPLSVPYIRKVADSLSKRIQGESTHPPKLSAWMVLPRNLLFLLIVLTHGFLRLIPRPK